MQAKIVPSLVLAALVAAGTALASGRWHVPERWNPWAPLRLADEPNWLTRHKLSRLAARPAECRDWLAATPMRFTPIADRTTAAGCGFENAVRVSATRYAIGQPVALSCRAAVALALWELHAVEPAARRLGEPVVRIEHFGGYACRDVGAAPGSDRAGGRRSRHSTADAIDIAGFVLRDGRRIQLQRHWHADDPRALFLRDVHRGACGVFDGVLGPDFNAAHADHLHLEKGPYRVCR